MGERTSSKGRHTPGPWRVGVSDATTKEAYLARIAQRIGHSPLVTFPCVWVPGHEDTILGDDPERPAHAVVVCDMGNGPNGDANADLIAAAPDMCEYLSDLRDSLAAGATFIIPLHIKALNALLKKARGES